VHVWDYPSGLKKRQIPLEKTADQQAAARAEFPVAVAPNGVHAAVAYAGEVKVLDLETGKLLWSAAGSEQQTEPSSLAFTPDSTQLISADLDGTVRLWDTAKGKELRSFGGPLENGAIYYGTFHHLALARDGKTLANAGLDLEKGTLQYTVGIRNLVTGEKLRSIAGARGADYASPGFSGDGKLLAFANGMSAILLADPETGKVMRTLETDKRVAAVSALRRFRYVSAFSPDNRMLYAVSGADLVAHEWDVASAKELRQLGLLTDSAGGVRASRGYTVAAVSPDGGVLLLAGGDQALHFVDLATGNAVGEPESTPHAPVGVRFADRGQQIVALTTDHGLQRWDLANGRVVTEFKGQGMIQPPAPAAGAFGGAAKGGGFGGAAKAGGSASYKLLSPDGHFAATVQAGGTQGIAIALSEPASRRELGTIQGGARETSAPTTAFSPDGNTLAIRYKTEQSIAIYSVTDNKKLASIPIVTLRPPGGEQLGGPVVAKVAPATMVLSENGRLLAAYADAYTFGVWDVSSGKRLAGMMISAEKVVEGGAFSADGRCLAVEHRDGTATLFELATGGVRQVFAGLGGAIAGWTNAANTGSYFQHGAKLEFGHRRPILAVGMADGTTDVWDNAIGVRLASLKGHDGSVQAVSFAPGDSLLATSSADTTILVWDAAKLPKATRTVQNLNSQEAWQALAGQDAVKAYQRMCDLTARPEQALDLLSKHLKPATGVSAEEIEKLIGQLGDPIFRVREKATADLLQIGERTLDIVDRKLASAAPEMRQRLVVLREKIGGKVHQGDALRSLRALEILERIGGTRAERLLETLAGGAADARITRTAAETLARMKMK
jgi:WD40 repeat protein